MKSKKKPKNNTTGNKSKQGNKVENKEEIKSKITTKTKVTMGIICGILIAIIIAIGIQSGKSTSTKTEGNIAKQSSTDTNQKSNTANKTSVTNNGGKAASAPVQTSQGIQTTITQGSGKITEKNGIGYMKFKDMVSLEELQKFDGKTVSLTGFMSVQSPLDGSHIYLMNMPYQSCVFCVPNNQQLANTMAVYPKSGKSFQFTDSPVTVTGKLSFKDITDDNGYSYNYYIADAKVEEANIGDMEETIKTYTGLVDKGFATTFINVLNNTYDTINYEQKNKKLDSLKPVSTDDVKKIKEMFNGLDASRYNDIKAITDRLEIYVNDVNKAVANKDAAGLQKLNDVGQSIYDDYYRWIMKPQL